VTTGVVTGTFNTLAASGALLPVDGMVVTFTPSSPVVLDAGASQTIAIAPVKALVKAGVLTDPGGAAGVTLVATDSTGINPTGFTWLAQFSGGPLGLNPFSFALPGGTTKDLASVSPVPPAPTPPVTVVTDGTVAGYVTAGGPTQGALDGRYTSTSKSSSDTLAAQNARALRTFRTALVNASSAPCDILFVGTSISEGQKSTKAENRFIAKLRDGLRALYQPAGVTGGFGYHPSLYSAQATTFTSLITNVGALNRSSSYGLGLRSYILSSSAATVTWTFTGTGFDLVYVVGPATGTFSYQVDGGAAVNVNTNNATLADGHTTQVRGLSATSHTVTINWVSGTSLVNGIMIYNGDETKGIRVWDGAHSGYASTDFAATPGWLQHIGTALNPSLVIIELSTNDYYLGKPVATLTANVQSMIASIKANMSNGTTPSFLLVNVWDRPQGGGTIVDTWANYKAGYAAVAASDANVALIDLSLRVNPGTASASGGLLDPTDMVHPVDLGHAFIGPTLVGYLSLK
jgi:lysophospholipase L1-like esterase